MKRAGGVWIRNLGLATALATVIFILVIPIIFYNVRQFRRLEAR